MYIFYEHISNRYVYICFLNYKYCVSESIFNTNGTTNTTVGMLKVTKIFFNNKCVVENN